MKYTLILFLSALFLRVNSQNLKPGFDKAEYLELLKIAQKQHLDLDKWKDNTSVPDPQDYKLVYRSKEIGLSNVWDLWVHKTKPVAVISVRGTTADPNSWLANFYAAMVPAKGQLKISKSFVFDYELSSHPQAAVHVGWLFSTAFISQEVVGKIDSCYKKGIKEFILTGHSQGGGITFLLSSHLTHLKSVNKLPQDILFKTYCSAGPKPGNLYYAYSFEHDNEGGWACNVVNTADWVPEVPFSIQTKDDFNKISIFTVSDKLINKQKYPLRAGMKHIYKKLTKPGIKAQKNYTRYMGKMVSKSIIKLYPEFETPRYYPSNNYVRTGVTKVLYADESYYSKFPNSDSNIWVHHFIEPYLFLTERLK